MFVSLVTDASSVEHSSGHQSVGWKGAFSKEFENISYVKVKLALYTP
jgi:hypothetical protein